MGHASKSDGIDADHVRFYARWVPSLRAGDYTVRATQPVTALGRDRLEPENDAEGTPSRAPFVLKDAEKDGYAFTATAPRFALSANDIYSIHPPKGQRGDFSETMPHVVLSKPTLPWMRRIDGHDTAPWLGLIVLSASDFAGPDGKSAAGPDGFPAVVNARLQDLLAPLGSDPKVLGPKLGEGDAESWLERDSRLDDPCSLLELPLSLFRAVAPKIDELALLTHVREVQTEAKETASLLSDGTFSVCIANRLPESESEPGQADAAVENRAYLISFEGLETYLEPDGAFPETARLRVAVLGQWSFFCAAGAGVAAGMEHLQPSRLVLPPPETKTGDVDYVRHAFEMGYAPFDHLTRVGETTVSWYRGPLGAVKHAKETNTKFRPTADAALRYSAQDGMFDVSYAAAYQLGRLLALQDRHFVAAMHGFRDRMRRALNRIIDNDRAQRDLGVGAVDSLGLACARYLGNLDQKMLDAHPSPHTPETAPTGSEEEKVTAAGVPIPAAISRWLGRLLLLYRVPFVYLVPDARMLPQNAMAFFALDPDWMKCLLEGACSAGRASARDELIESELRGHFLDFAYGHASEIRSGRLVPGRVDNQPDRALSETGQSPNWPLSGFIMRSPLVRGWQGVEMRAWQTANDGTVRPLSPLRIDRISPEIMLCIFDGNVTEIEIRQPPEGQFFGLSRSGQADVATYEKLTLRRLSDADGPDETGKAAGAIIDGAGPVTAGMRQGAARVLDVAKLAQDFAAAGGLGTLDSAGMAVQMVESAKVLKIKRGGVGA